MLAANNPRVLPSPVSSEDDVRTPSPAAQPRPNPDLAILSPPIVPPTQDGPDHLTPFLSDPKLLSILLAFFSFYDWCLILSLSREIRFMVVQNPHLRETVLERFLSTVGYKRWVGDDPDDNDPLSLSLQVLAFLPSLNTG